MPAGRMKIVVPGVNGSDDLFLNVLRAIIGVGASGHSESLIDLCCNMARLTRHLGFDKRTYVDVLQRDLEEESPYFVQADVLGDHPVLKESYDVSTCLDGIEHIYKEQGEVLISRMIQISKKRIIFTPLDPWMMEPHNPHPETHKSVWTPEDLPDWASIVYPVYHPTLDIGAWFGWHCDDLEQDFQRVRRELRLN